MDTELIGLLLFGAGLILAFYTLFREIRGLKATKLQLATGLACAKPVFYDYEEFKRVYGMLDPQVGTLLVLPNRSTPKSIEWDDQWAEVAKDVWMFCGPCPSGFCGGDDGAHSWNDEHSYMPDNAPQEQLRLLLGDHPEKDGIWTNLDWTKHINKALELIDSNDPLKIR